MVEFFGVAGASFLGAGEFGTDLVGSCQSAGGGGLLQLDSVEQNLDAVRGDGGRLDVLAELAQLGHDGLQGGFEGGGGTLRCGEGKDGQQEEYSANGQHLFLRTSMAHLVCLQSVWDIRRAAYQCPAERTPTTLRAR